MTEVRRVMSRITRIRDHTTVTVGARRAAAERDTVLLYAHRPLRICVTVPLMTPTTRAVMCHRVTTLSHTVGIPHQPGRMRTEQSEPAV